ncbi:MAG: hypothetical protein KC656_09200, partial [Myxococcales bacterium]|nr:hypothetical protein [Myxococcales bacterium]
MTFWMLAVGCSLLELPPTPNCADRGIYWPDEDGDGVGEPGTAYVGCEPPEGWVTVVDTDVDDTG